MFNIVETDSAERTEEFERFKEIYLKKLDVPVSEIKKMFDMGNGRYTTFVKRVKEETGYMRQNKNGVILISVGG